MAHIVLQFGQCGNQLGAELFDLAFNDAVHSSTPYWSACSRDSWFFHTAGGQLKARAVLVDSEKKVLNTFRKKGQPWKFNTENIVSANIGGSGNNFALGYSETGSQVSDGALEVLRKECEKCDRIRGLISLGSCGGGTGSGAGTFILEQVRDSYPQKNLISVLVTPYSSGEVVIQNNNMLFTLSKQYNICDALVLFENDLLSNTIAHQFRLKNVAFFDLNKIISQYLLGFLQPVKPRDFYVDLYDFISQLCPMSRYKFLSIQSFPVVKESRSKFDGPPSWNTLEREIVRSLKSSLYSANIDFINAVANTVISRGQHVPDNTIKKLKSTFFYPNWIPQDYRFPVYHQPRQLLNHEKNLTIISNNSKICGLLDSCISKAWKLFTNNMYVHHYYKFGFTKETYTEAFTKAETILKDYKDLAK